MKRIILPALAASMVMFFGCTGGGSAQGAAGEVAGKSGAAIGPSCKDGGENHLCVALKYVAYDDENGKPVVTQEQAANNLVKINQAWQQCGISFQVEQYDAVHPKDLGLTYDTANTSELDGIRTALQSRDKLLIVTTGLWNRTGTLGGTGANAWTSMPGDNRDGAILESSVSTFPLIIAHEIGHYLNLDHVSDTSDLMNPIIYDDSAKLDSGQCAAARDAVDKYWPAMKR